jgi:hypothetical protein
MTNQNSNQTILCRKKPKVQAKTGQLLFFLFFIVLHPFFSQGQITWDDWGGSSTPYTLNSGTLILGTVHAQVNVASSTVGANILGPITTISGYMALINASASGFTVGDIVMFVQMDKNAGARNYDLGRVTAIGSGTINVDFAEQAQNNATLSVSDMHVDWSNTGALVQVVKIECYSDLTINGGTITCDPWDGHSGGILAIDVEGTLTLNGGTINVDGKGFSGGATVSGGSNGVTSGLTKGSAASTRSAAGGYAAFGVYTRLDGSMGNKLGDDQSPACSGKSRHNGGDGGTGTFVGIAESGDAGPGAAANTGENHGEVADPNHLYINLGAGGASGASGRGSSSGGGGGGGGAGYYYSGDGQPSLDPADGQDGNTASAGHGGDGGAGGAGGGFIYLRAKNISGTMAGLFYVTDISANGSPGIGGSSCDATGTPGAGGNGGRGGDGYCDGTDLWAAGGGGAGGFGGDGGDGGDGGFGGVPGGILLIYDDNYNISPAVHLITNDGLQGTAGAGVNGAVNGNDGVDGSGVNVNCIQSGSVNCFKYVAKSPRKVIHLCDCDDAFTALGQVGTCTDGDPVWDFNVGNASYTARWNAFGLESHKFTTGSSTATHSGNALDDAYLCDMSAPCDFFTHLCEAISGNYFGAADISGGNVGWGGSPNYSGGYYIAQSSPPYWVYRSTDLTASNAQWCESGCHSDGFLGKGGNSVVHPRGYFGTTTDENDATGSYFPGNNISDPLGPLFQKPKNAEIPPLTINPNPAGNLLNVNYFNIKNAQNYQLTVIDNMGKEVISLNFIGQNGQNTFTLKTENIAAGSYILKLRSNGTVQKANFIKK